MVWKVINTLIISIWNVDNREFVQSVEPLFSVQNHCFQCRTIVLSAEPLLSVQNHCFDQRGIVFERSRDTAHGLGSPIQP